LEDILCKKYKYIYYKLLTVIKSQICLKDIETSISFVLSTFLNFFMYFLKVEHITRIFQFAPN